MFEVSDANLPKALSELFGPFRYSHMNYAGVVLLPKFNTKQLLGEEMKHKVSAIYVNPAYDDEKFGQFLELATKLSAH